MALCLVVEDHERQRAVTAGTLRAEGYEVVEAASGAECRTLCRQHRPEIVLLDLGLPDGDGLELIPGLLESSPLSRIVVLTGRNSVTSAVTALRAGACHYLVKPWEEEELLLVLERESRTVDLAESRSRAASTEVFWGSDARMRLLRGRLEKLAESPLTPVLIEGETGSGKEVVARELHRLTPESGPFVALNCAAVPENLLESELFGHERGAFTGATSRRRGLAELARGGVLFLDEIGEMAPGLQTKLLRFLQDFRFRRVGGSEELSSRCRVVAATHRDLVKLQEGGSFRADLFYRLAVVRLEVPPLRDRVEDLLPLAEVLLADLASSLGRRPRRLGPAAESALRQHSWSGNVRELRNRLERALVLSEGEELGPDDLDLERVGPSARGSVDSEDELARVRRALEAEGGNVSRAARRLGVARHWLRYRMRKIDLEGK